MLFRSDSQKKTLRGESVGLSLLSACYFTFDVYVLCSTNIRSVGVGPNYLIYGLSVNVCFAREHPQLEGIFLFFYSGCKQESTLFRKLWFSCDWHWTCKRLLASTLSAGNTAAPEILVERYQTFIIQVCEVAALCFFLATFPFLLKVCEGTFNVCFTAAFRKMIYNCFIFVWLICGSSTHSMPGRTELWINQLEITLSLRVVIIWFFFLRKFMF